MKCPNCGSFIQDDSKFCNYCGEKLNRKSVSDIPAMQKRPRDEDFDVEIMRRRQEEEDEAANAQPNRWVVLAILLSGVVLAVIGMLLYSFMKNNQHIIINPTTTEAEPPETTLVPTEGASSSEAVTESETETEPLPTETQPTEPPTTEPPTETEPPSTDPEYTDINEGGLIYRLTESENKAVLLRCFNNDNVIRLPEEVNGLPLLEIGPEAFTHSTYICYISIPENVFAIHDGCFANCSELREIVLPDSLQLCNAAAFEGTSGFTIISNAGTRGQSLAGELGVEWTEGTTLSVD